MVVANVHYIYFSKTGFDFKTVLPSFETALVQLIGAFIELHDGASIDGILSWIKLNIPRVRRCFEASQKSSLIFNYVDHDGTK